MSLPSAAHKKRGYVMECPDVLLNCEEICSSKEKRTKTSDEDGLKFYNFFDIQESVLDTDFVKDNNDCLFDQNMLTTIFGAEPPCKVNYYNDISNDSMQEIFTNTQTFSASHIFNNISICQHSRDIQETLPILSRPLETVNQTLLQCDQIVKNTPCRPSTVKFSMNQINNDTPYDDQIIQNNKFSNNEENKLPMMQSFLELKKLPKHSSDILMAANLLPCINRESYNNQLMSLTDHNFTNPLTNLVTIGPKISLTPDMTYSPSEQNVFQPSKHLNNQYCPFNIEYGTSQCDRMQFYTEDFKSNNIFYTQKNEISTIEKKLPKYVLQALMDKIKRNQTAKKQINNVDVINQIRVTKNNSKSKTLDIINSFNFCERETQENKTLENSIANTRHKSHTSDIKEKCETESNHQFLKNTSYLHSFTFHLKAPISSVLKADIDHRITYLNKGQYYILSLECISEKLKWNQAVLKTIVMVLFHDNSSILGKELSAWRTWHNKQQSFRQRILDVDFKNESIGRPLYIIELAFNATSVVWKANSSNIMVNVAVNCLSTDFSNQKGVKGIPLIMQLDTYLQDDLIHRAQCHIKVFCDKGAERKVRDEGKRNKDSMLLDSQTPSLSSNFHLFDDFTKIPILFNPKPNVPIKTKSSNLDSIFKNENLLKDDDKSNKITLFVKEDHELAFNELLLDKPTVESLLKAIAYKYNVKQESIKNLYKISKKGILVKVDDQVIRHYGNESTYIIRTEQSINPSMFDVTLQEMEI